MKPDMTPIIGLVCAVERVSIIYVSVPMGTQVHWKFIGFVGSIGVGRQGLQPDHKAQGLANECFH